MDYVEGGYGLCGRWLWTVWEVAVSYTASLEARGCSYWQGTVYRHIIVSVRDLPADHLQLHTFDCSPAHS